MITRNQTKIKTVLTLAAAMAILATSANAAIVVTPDHIVSGSATATLLAIDVPYQVKATLPVTGGPDWPEDADDGFTTVNDGIMEENGTSRWEPDGTPLSEAIAYFTYGNGPPPGVKYVFDVPDGRTIYAIYATWNTRNVDGCTYQYTEGAASGSFVTTQQAAPNGDLVLRWTDSSAATHDGDFELLFTEPITVTGGDGFELWATDNIGNAAHIDAVVIDVAADPNAPDVDAGVDMITLSGMDVVLAPTVFNNDPNVPQRPLSYTWTTDAPVGYTVEWDPSNTVEAPTVTITQDTPGNPQTVTLTLEVDLVGTSSTASDTMEIDVYNDACLAAKAVGPVELDPSDFDENCTTDLRDYALLAAKWLVDYALTAPIPKP